MKNIKYLILFIFGFALFGACNEDDTYDISAIDAITAPTNVSAIFNITQDNSGLVTIIPQADGVARFTILCGDVADETPSEYKLNEVATHIYQEGVYTVNITAFGVTGLKTSITQELTISFKAPENLAVSISQDAINPKIVSVSAVADFATVMEIYFGDQDPDVAVMAMPGEVVQRTYTTAGTYTIRVVAKSAGAATAEYSEDVVITDATDPITFPIDFESFTINYAFGDFGNAFSSVVDNPDASGLNTSAKVGLLFKTNGSEVWAGGLLTLGDPINFSTKKLFYVKVWSPKAGAVVKLKVENLDDGAIAHEVDAMTTTSNAWEEIAFDFSEIDESQSYQKVVLFFDFGNPGDDATYYFDDIRQAVVPTGTPLVVGVWKMAPEAGAFGVGPEQGDISWFSNSIDDVTLRDCFFDDTYIFDADGSFKNELGSTTWIEGWQGGTDACEALVAPHDGSNPATYLFNQSAGTVTLEGVGSFLGIPKAFNGGELTNPADAPASVTYIVEFIEEDTVMIVDINIGGGWWRYKMVKDQGQAATPLTGTWKMAPEAGAFGVGPEQGDISWYANNADDLNVRDCFFDDLYVFGIDGSFSNVVGDSTWIEGWQGGGDACDVPVAPHDGSNPATYIYDEIASTVTLNGTGSFLGIPKAFNGGELTDPADAPASITYEIMLTDQNTVMIADVNIGGGWWRYKLVKN